MPIKAITPKGIDLKAHEMAIRSGLITGLDKAEVLFHQSYYNWEPENAPKFKTSGPDKKGNDLVAEYTTDDVPFLYVSNGTPPHTITPKKAGGFLTFKAGSQPKTFAGKLLSSSGRPGTDWRRAKSVEHPGIEARNFPELVVEQLQPAVVGIIARAISSTTGG